MENIMPKSMKFKFNYAMKMKLMYVIILQQLCTCVSVCNPNAFKTIPQVFLSSYTATLYIGETMDRFEIMHQFQTRGLVITAISTSLKLSLKSTCLMFPGEYFRQFWRCPQAVPAVLSPNGDKISVLMYYRNANQNAG